MLAHAWLVSVMLLPTPWSRADSVCLPSTYLSNMVEQQLARMLVPDGLSQVMYPFHVEQRIGAEDIVYSTEEPLCAFGRRRYEAEVRHGEADSSARVHVWRIGPVLAVLDPAYQEQRGPAHARYVLMTDDEGHNLGLYLFEVPDYPW